MTTIDPRRRPGSLLTIEPDTGINIPALGPPEPTQPLPQGQPGQALASQAQPGQQVEKPKPNLFESVGKAIGTMGKSIAENPEVAGMLARIGIAFGTSPSGVQSLGARLGTQVLAGVEAKRTGELAERRVSVEEQRAITLESKLQFEKDTWDSLSSDRALRTTAMTQEAQARLNESTARMQRASAAELDAEARLLEARIAQNKKDLSSQIQLHKTYDMLAKIEVERLGFGKLIRHPDGSTTFNITKPFEAKETYDEVYGGHVRRAIDLELLPEHPVVSFEGESPLDTIEQGDVFRDKLDKGNRGEIVEPPAPVTAGDVDLGAIMAGVPGFGGEDVGKVRAAQEAAISKRQEALEARVTSLPWTKGTLLGFEIGKPGKTTPPEGGGKSEGDPILLYTGNDTHNARIEKELKQKGIYLDIDGVIWKTTGDPDNPIRITPSGESTL